MPKISELTAGTTLDNTEAIPGVQGGRTLKFTPAQLSTYALTLGLDATIGTTEGTFLVRGASSWGARTITGSDLPNPTATTLGGVFALPVTSNSVLSGIGVDGVPTRATTTGTDNVVRSTNPTISQAVLVSPNVTTDLSFASFKLYNEAGSLRTFYLPNGTTPVIQWNATDLYFKSDVISGLNSGTTVTHFRWTSGLLQLGGADAAAPAAQTVQAQGVVTGTANTAGTDWTINASVSTGTGTPGSIKVQTGFAAAGSASTPNAVATVLTLGPSSLLGSATTPVADWAQTWNTSGNATAFRWSVTSTAFGATSLIFDFRAGAGGATSRFALRENGLILSNGVGFGWYNTGLTTIDLYSGAGGIRWLNAAGGAVIGGLSNVGVWSFYGATSGSTAVQAAAVASGTLTLPAATDTLVGKATTDTLTNKTYDTAGTGNAFKLGGVTVALTSEPAGAVIRRSLSVQHSGDTNDSSSGSGSFRAHDLTYTIPANFLTSGRAIRVIAHFRLTTGGTPTAVEIQLKLGGTIVAHYSPGTPTASATNMQHVLEWIIQATAAPGAAVDCECAMMTNSNGLAGATVDSNTAQPVALATNGTLAITVEDQWAGAGVGTNQIKLSQLIVEAIN